MRTMCSRAEAEGRVGKEIANAESRLEKRKLRKPGNSGENSNGTVHLGGNFPVKK